LRSKHAPPVRGSEQRGCAAVHRLSLRAQAVLGRKARHMTSRDRLYLALRETLHSLLPLMRVRVRGRPTLTPHFAPL